MQVEGLLGPDPAMRYISITIDIRLWFGNAENPAVQLLLLPQKWGGRMM